jgi:hypothetical protein
MKMTTTEQSQRDFGNYMNAVMQDETKLKQFVGSVTDPKSLQAFAAAHGYRMPASEAERVYAKGRALLDASSGQGPLNDDLLESVNGGISLSAIGAAIGGLGAAGALTLAVGLAMAPVSGGASLAMAAAAIAGLSSSAAASVAVGAVAAGALGAGIGAAGGYVIEHS